MPNNLRNGKSQEKLAMTLTTQTPKGSVAANSPGGGQQSVTVNPYQAHDSWKT